MTDDALMQAIQELLDRRQKYIPARLVKPLVERLQFFNARSARYLDVIVDLSKPPEQSGD